MKQKILITAPYANPETGAAVIRVNYLKKFFELKGHQVTILAPARWKNNKSSKDLIRYTGFLDFIKKLFTLDYDIVLGEVPPVRDAFFAWLVSMLRSKKFFVDERDIFYLEMNETLKFNPNGFKYKLNHFFEKTIYRNASKVFSVTIKDIGEIVNHFGADKKKVFLARNGTDTDLLKFNGKLRKEMRVKLKIDNSSKVIVFVGNLGNYAIMDFFDNCVNQKLLSKKIHFLFVVTYDGSVPGLQEINDLNQKINSLGLQKNFTLVKNVPYEKINPYLCASDLGIVPYTGLIPQRIPAKTYDFLALGLPTIIKGKKGSEIDILFQKDLEGYFVTNWVDFSKKLILAVDKNVTIEKRNLMWKNINENYSRKRSAEIIYREMDFS